MSIKVSEYQFQNDKIKKEPAQAKNSENAQAEPVVRQTNTIPSELLKGAYGVVPFKAKAAKTDSHSIPFTANPLYNVNLKKLVGSDSYKTISAKFSELIPKSKDDAQAMLKVQDVWGKIGKTSYAKCIINDFIENRSSRRSHFVTEITDDSKELAERITCLLETTNPKTVKNKDKFEIHLLQASPDIADNPDSKIRGSGELSLYGVVKVAKKNHFKCVNLFSTNNSFYEKMGFKQTAILDDPKPPNEGGVYELSSDKFDSFLKKVAKKYDIN